jgi:hypothetical protein
MARPERNNVDYFPFMCEDGNKMFYIEETYGNDGFATFLKLLRELAKTNYHYLDLSKPTTQMFLSAKCKVSKDVLISIINDLVELGKFDFVLWNENKIIWCQDFIDSIQDAYNKRNNKCITYDGLLLLLCSLGIRKPIKGTSTVPVNTQSKVNNSKVNENKENIYRSFIHLSISIDEVEKLKIDYDIKTIDSILDSIENYKDNKKYKSLYLTAKKWLEKEPKKDSLTSGYRKPTGGIRDSGLAF